MNKRRNSRGFALVLAAFLVVTLSAIAVYLVTVQTGQATAISQDEQATRAQLAARTGMELAAFQILRNSADCTAVNQTLPLQQGLAGYFVKIECASSSEDEGERSGAQPIQLFRITATGCNDATCPFAGTPPLGYVERQLHLTLAR